MVRMGDTVRDRITGFEGIVTGRCEYITGCDQVLVQPRGLDEKGQPFESRWIDVQRVEPVPHTSRVVLDNGNTPGPDKPAPRR